MPPSEEEIRELEEFDYYQALIDSIPESYREVILKELDSHHVIARANLLKEQLERQEEVVENIMHEFRVKQLLLAGLRQVREKQISVAQLASFHILRSAIQTLYEDPAFFYIFESVEGGKVSRNTTTEYVTDISLIPRDITTYGYEDTGLPEELSGKENLPKVIITPLLKRFFNFNTSEWTKFCDEIKQAPKSEQRFHALIAPEAGCWSNVVFKIQEDLKCLQILDRIVNSSEGYIKENIMLVPSFSMFQAALNAKAYILNQQPVTLIPTYGYMEAWRYAELKSQGKIAFTIYLPGIGMSYRTTIDGQPDETAFAGAIHDFNHALRQLAMSENVEKAQMRARIVEDLKYRMTKTKSELGFTPEFFPKPLSYDSRVEFCAKNQVLTAGYNNQSKFEAKLLIRLNEYGKLKNIAFSYIDDLDFKKNNRTEGSFILTFFHSSNRADLTHSVSNVYDSKEFKMGNEMMLENINQNAFELYQNAIKCESLVISYNPQKLLKKLSVCMNILESRSKAGWETSYLEVIQPFIESIARTFNKFSDELEHFYLQDGVLFSDELVASTSGSASPELMEVDMPPSEEEIEEIEEFDSYQELINSIPESYREMLLSELDESNVIERSEQLEQQLERDKMIVINQDESSRILFLAGLRQVRDKQISASQLASFHIWDSAIRTLYIQPMLYLIYKYVKDGKLLKNTIFLAVENISRIPKTIPKYNYNSTGQPKDLPHEYIPKAMREPLLKRFFNFNTSEWTKFCDEIKKAPKSERGFYALTVPVFGCWSSFISKIQSFLSCVQILDRLNMSDEGYIKEKIMVVPSFSMFQAAINAKACTLNRRPVILTPTYGYLEAKRYAELKSQGRIAFTIYLPGIGVSYRTTIDEHPYETAFAGAIHDFYHALREMAMSENVAKARMRWAMIAREHPNNLKDPSSRAIDDLLVDGELSFSYAPEQDTMFNLSKRPKSAQIFGDLFYTYLTKDVLHPELKNALIRDMVENKELWQKEFKLGRSDLRPPEQAIYDDILREMSILENVEKAARIVEDLKYRFIRGMVVNHGLWQKEFKLCRSDLNEPEQAIYDEIQDQIQDEVLAEMCCHSMTT